MKNSLFIAAVVLFCTQALDAVPCTTCNNGGTKTVTTTHTFTPVTYTATSFNSGNTFGTNVNGGQTVTKFQTSSSNSDVETLRKNLNFGQNGKTETVFNWSTGGKGGNDIDSSNSDIQTLKNHLNSGQNGKTEIVFNWGAGGKGGNDNDNNGCKTCGQGAGNNNVNLEAEKAKNLMLQREIESLQKLLSEQQKQYNQVNVQWKTCSTKLDQLTIEINQLKQTNINWEVKFEQSKTTIINLTNSVQKITTDNQGNEKALIELQHTNEILIIKSENCQKNVAELTRSNKNLQQKNQEINITINQYKNSNSELSAKFSAQQQSLQTSQLNLSNCERERQRLELAYTIAVEKYDEDEKDDVLREMDLQATALHLTECEEKLGSLQEQYTSQQANSAECKDQITSIQIELTTTINNYETSISNLNILVNELKNSLQTEIDIKNTFILANKKCESNNINIIKQSELLTQALSDAKLQFESCSGDLDISNSNYSALQITVENITQKLADCDSVSSTIQFELETYKAKLDSCSNELTGVTVNLTEVENKNIQLGDQITLLENLLQNCEEETKKLRCTANKGFGTIEESENAIRPILQRYIDNINNLTAEREKLVANNDFPCLYA